ncbi:MAG: ACP S-malonyltransferase [Clostridiales bacterium]|nr:ACP S-malonyltransferase [Clostridiales bacterium]
MRKTAFMFPGQGSQYIGMGQDFYENFPCSREIIDLAGEASGYDMKALLFEENDQININRYTQVAMLADELAVLKAVESKGFSCDVSAGLSLGEYGAMVTAGVLTPEDAFKVVTKRGIYMEEAYPTGGGMTAVMGLDAETIEKVCEQTDGIVSVANYNCPGQIVITGEKTAVDAAAAGLKEAGAKRCVPLNVSGPFHCALLSDAGEKLAADLMSIEIHDISTPYISSVTADYVTDISIIKDIMRRQISSPVRWQQSVERMIADGVEVFIELGPKKSLTGFMKKIDKKAVVYHVDKMADLDALCEAFSDDLC